MANITAKELTALEDQIASEQNLVKKCKAMADLCNDTVIRQTLENAAITHQQHVDSLVTFLR